MSVSVKKPPTIIPSYSLTGDLLAFSRCPLQYRYYNKASLPPSTPVQQWFGEFIHGVMELAFLRWRDNKWKDFPWDWQGKIKLIEMEIFKRLGARGMKAPPNLFRRYHADRKDIRLIASLRAEASINEWGPHLFPIIEHAEVRLKGSREMPTGVKHPRARYFSVTGVVDVISSLKLEDAQSSNEIAKALCEIPSIKKLIESAAEPFDIIVDYKGMGRPGITEPVWEHHEWQIRTYAWLRNEQEPDRTIVAGVVLYLNELCPSDEDRRALIEAVRQKNSDVLPVGDDADACRSLSALKKYGLSNSFRKRRSVRIVEISPETIDKSLAQFSKVVGDIEVSVGREIAGVGIVNAWKANPERTTCVACDFKYDCPDAKKGLGAKDRTPHVP